MATEYFGQNTLTALIGLIKKGLNDKIDITDIVNDTTTGGTDKPLSAEAGKLLAESISKAGYGDMLESKYAKNGGASDGKVDAALKADTAAKADSAKDAEKLGAALPAAYMMGANFAKNGGASDGKVDHALVADNAINATNAVNADHATSADHATEADTAKSATEASHATDADTAKNAAKAASADKAADSEKLGGKDPSAYLEVAKVGAASGVAPLNPQGQIDAAYLPSYVDDVIEGYYHNGEFYKEDSHSTKIEGERGKIYVDLGSEDSTCYRYSGSAYIKIVSSDLVEISSQEVERIWNNTQATA